MLLRRLVEYSARRDPVTGPALPHLYAERPIRYFINLDPSGRAIGPLVDTADPNERRTRKGTPLSAPQVQRSVGIKPLLLADKADYTLGFAGPGAKADRVAACHEAYRQLLDRCAVATGEPEVRAVATFLANRPLHQLTMPADFDPGATITFRVNDRLPIDLPAVQRFWADSNDPILAGAPVMQCVICGRERPVLLRLQDKIKGVPGGQTSGTSIISANARAFESYGLAASLVAPTCAECGERFTRAANSLLKDEQSRVVIGNSIFIAWTRQPVPFSIRQTVVEADPAQVRLLIEGVHSGRATAGVDDTAFYGTVLSASGGRTVVRDWLDTTVGEVKSSLARWFEQQDIVDPNRDERYSFGLFALAAATVRDPRRDLSPTVPRALLRAALTRTPLPWSLLDAAVRRSRVEQTVTRPRAALIKLVLLTQRLSTEEGVMVHLDADEPSAAYRCGRLLAVLEEAQRAALPGVKAGIVDRFYGTASTAPGSVFPRLLRGVRPHLGKLERDRPGAWRALEQRLDEIQAGLHGFPRVLTLEQQGLFALGYYHQRAQDRHDAREAAERRSTLTGQEPAVAQERD
jgi:CRISPR-associated protein Csd1